MGKSKKELNIILLKELPLLLEKQDTKKIKIWFDTCNITKENFVSNFLDKILQLNHEKFITDEKNYQKWLNSRTTAVAHTRDYHPAIYIEPGGFLKIADALKLSTKEIIDSYRKYIKSYNPRSYIPEEISQFLLNRRKLLKIRSDIFKTIIEKYGIRDAYLGIGRYNETIAILEKRHNTQNYSAMLTTKESLDIKAKTILQIEKAGTPYQKIIDELESFQITSNGEPIKAYTKMRKANL